MNFSTHAHYLAPGKYLVSVTHAIAGAGEKYYHIALNAAYHFLIATRGKHYGSGTNLHNKQSSLAFLLLFGCWLLISSLTTYAATLKVCPTCTLKLPSQAASTAKDGDTIEIEAGPYYQDAAVWRASNLTMRGINGKAQLFSRGASVEGKAIWVIKGNDTTVENIEFADARVPDKNGAGIRQEGTNLTVRNCMFRDNENGILAGTNVNSTVLIETTVFDHNGHGDGQSHNIYVGNIARFILKDSVSRKAKIGHQVKSRAAYNLIANNTIEDGLTGQSSYLIDLPSGGEAHIHGNTLHQGKSAENFTMVAYGAENRLHSNNSLTIANNIFKNDRHNNCRLIWIKPTDVTATLNNNKYNNCTRIDGNYSD